MEYWRNFGCWKANRWKTQRVVVVGVVQPVIVVSILDMTSSPTTLLFLVFKINNTAEKIKMHNFGTGQLLLCQSLGVQFNYNIAHNFEVVLV